MSDTIEKEIAIEKLAHGGDGLGYLRDGRVVFVSRAIPGDVVDVRVETSKQSWARGQIDEIRKASEARVPVECDGFERGCGGCQFWGMDFDDEMKWKSKAAVESMERISGLDLPEPALVEAPSKCDYRSRVTFHQRKVDGTLERGFYAQTGSRLVPIERCPIARPELEEAIAELDGAIDLLGRADIRVETAGQGQAVVLVELSPGGRIDKSDLEEVARRVEQGTVVRGVEVLDETGDYYIIGDTTVDIDEVLARPPVQSMLVESGRFRQANQPINEKLVDHVSSLVAEGWDRPRVVELFCGAGNLSFPVAESAERLVGFEKSRGAVETARQIATLSQRRDNLAFRVADLSDDEEVARALEEPFEVLILDPPRRGAPTVAEQMSQGDRAGQIIYVSCDAACLARDAETLADGGWEMDRLCLFDMFPRTAHLEAVAVFER